MSNIQYAVCHLQRGSGNDSGMSRHIERKTAAGKVYIPDNADKTRTHLNRELITFSDGVRNRTESVQFRIDNAELHRKVGKNQTKAIRIILTGSHEQMMKIEQSGRLDKWTDANMKWLRDTFGEDNVVSCVLHMDEKTSTYQHTYAEAMREFGLQRGVVGSTARHQSNGEYYRQQMLQYENDIARLNAEVEKANEGRSAILSLFGKGNLAKAKKELTDKDEQIAKLKEQIKTLQAERAAIVQQHRQELATLKNSYQAEIDKAIKETELLRKTLDAKDARIKQQSQRIAELDRKANPQRYRLSSGAELVKVNIPNLEASMPSIHIWTDVQGEKYDAREYIDTINPVWQEYLKGTATIYELINDIFEPQEQVNEAQADLLGATLILATGGPAQTRIGTGAGGSHSDLPWDGKKNTGRRR